MSGTVQSEAFRDPARERIADAFGMWIFIGSEAMLFGSLFLIYLTARQHYPDAFAGASRHLSLTLGTLNTAVLLTSSFTMALAHSFSGSQRWRSTALALAGTAMLGLCFLAIKGTEYWLEYREGIAPILGLPFRFDGHDPVHARLFFNLYFVTTLLHAAHLLGGIAVVTGMLVLWGGTRAASRSRRVQAIGLYWHFVDIVWVFLFPVLYLIDR